jgi:hypothetical protein
MLEAIELKWALGFASLRSVRLQRKRKSWGDNRYLPERLLRLRDKR